MKIKQLIKCKNKIKVKISHNCASTESLTFGAARRA